MEKSVIIKPAEQELLNIKELIKEGYQINGGKLNNGELTLNLFKETDSPVQASQFFDEYNDEERARLESEQ